MMTKIQSCIKLCLKKDFVEYFKISRAAQWETIKLGQRIITQCIQYQFAFVYNGTVDKCR